MRIFYEEWKELEANSSVATDELQLIDSEGNEIRQLQLTNYAGFPIVAFLSIGFTHHSAILAGTKSMEERKYYIQICYNQKLSVDGIQKRIAEDAFHNQGKMPNNFVQTIPGHKQAFKAIQMFKDEYLLDFINVEELDEQEEDLDEKIVEKAIVANVKKFIMTFGQDFSFIGNQYRMEVAGEEMFIDLLFFNRELNSLVAVELKSGKFRTSYLGQLNTYLSALDSYVRKSHENPSIGIILCREMNQTFVEFAVRDYNKPMGVATYRASEDMPERLRNALPDIEDLKKLL